MNDLIAMLARLSWWAVYDIDVHAVRWFDEDRGNVLLEAIGTVEATGYRGNNGIRVRRVWQCVIQHAFFLTKCYLKNRFIEEDIPF